MTILRRSAVLAGFALLATASLRPDVVIALQPISQKPMATELAMATCIARNWRLSIQTHKYLNID